MSTHVPRHILLTGATGYVGGSLLPILLEDGHQVRALARNGDRARAKLPDAVEVAEGDVVGGTGLAEALDGIGVAYYLVHSMGRGSGSAEEFAERDRRAAANFGRAAKDAGVERVIYLGGLEGLTRRRQVRAPAQPRGGRGDPRRARAARSMCARRW